MSNNEINIGITAKADTDNATKKVQKLSKALVMLQQSSKNTQADVTYFQKINAQAVKQAEATKRLNFENQGLVKTLQAGQKATIGFNGAMLSLMFGGMALQRVAGGALTSIFETYKKLIPESDQFNKATTRLSANWEFFKFQLADAFAKSGLFQLLIAGAIKLLQWFQKLSPEVKQFIIVALGIAAITGTLLIIIGTMSLLISSIIDVGIAFGIMTISAETGMVAMSASLIKYLALFGTFLLVAAIFYEGWKLISDIQSKNLDAMGLEVTGTWNKITSVVVTFIAGLATIIVQGVAGIINIFLLLGSSIAAVFGGVLKSAFNFGKAIVEAIRVGIMGGDWKSAFIDTFDFKGILNNVKTTFNTGLQDAFKVSDVANNISADIRGWEVTKQIDWANATPTASATKETVINNNVFVSTLEQGLAQGVISQEQYDTYKYTTTGI